MPVEISDTPIVTANMASPIAPIAASMSGMDTAQKKVAEMGFKGKNKKDDDDDPTDNDPCYLFELTKIAIENGAQVEPINLEKLAPKFEEEAKQRTKKYTSAKVVSFFTGGTFTFLIYLAFEFFKTL